MMGNSNTVRIKKSVKKPLRKVVVATTDEAFEQQMLGMLNGLRKNTIFLHRTAEVLLTILHRDVDLLILDLEFTGIGGLELIPIVRKSRPRLPVIVISADFNYQLRKTVAEEGIFFQAFKPIDEKEANYIADTAKKVIEEGVHL